MRPELKVLRNTAWLMPRHTALIAKLCRALQSPGMIQQYMADFSQLTLQVWEIGDSALVLTRVKSYQGRTCLWIEGIVGSGMIAHARDIRDDLELIARSYGCEIAAGKAHRPGLQLLYQKLGLETLSVTFGMEIS